MPSTSHAGITGVPWSRCDRCGLDFCLSDLVMQNGLLLCLASCFDDPYGFTRDQLIQELLSNGSGEELKNVTAEKRAEPNDYRSNTS